MVPSRPSPEQPDPAPGQGGAARLPDWTIPAISRLDSLRLEHVLKHLRRVTSEGRRRAAQDPATRMYLQAGLRLLEQQVMPVPAQPDDDLSNHPFLNWISRARVAAETANEPEGSELPRQGTQAGLRDRWEPHSDYLTDLLLVALAAERWAEAVNDVPDYWQALRESRDIKAVVEEVAYLVLQGLQQSAGFRIQLLTLVISAREEPLREALASMYQQVVAERARNYADVLTAQGLRLREGISSEDFGRLLTALADGLALQAIAEPSSPVLDHDRRRSLLGVGSLAILALLTDADGDGRSVDEVLSGLFGPDAPASDA